MKAIAIILLILISLICSISAEPINDTSKLHWAYDSVELLSEKGLIEGYPDGYFKGDRPLSRYEMAVIISRIIAKVEQLQSSVPQQQDMSNYITQDDVKKINALVNEYKDELNSLGIRVGNVETSINKLTDRVSELERVKISGQFKSVFMGVGYSPGEKNTSSYGNINTNPLAQPPYGPRVVSNYYRYLFGLGLYQGSASISELRLKINAKLSEKVTVGGELEAYSAFGERGLFDSSIIPPYNPLGSSLPNGINFQADLSSVWVKVDGDASITGEFGNFTLKKVSHNLFVGPRSLYLFGDSLKLPMNGLHVTGNLYKQLEIEAFMARNINSYLNFAYPDTTDPLFYYGGTNGYIHSNWTWYPLATPYNDGAGAIHQFSYGRVSPGQYDNYLYGIWLGRDFLDGKAHIEGTYLNLFEDFASNPDVSVAKVYPKGAVYYGINGYYKLLDKKITISSEFNQTSFNYNLVLNSNTYKGSYFNIKVTGEFDNISFYGKFLRIDANYDPFGYHSQWEKEYADFHHLGRGWSTWKMGSVFNGTRYSDDLHNRIGCDFGMDYFWGEKKQWQIYGNIAYIRQLNPTLITNDENSFQKIDFLNGIPISNTIGANIYGNQDRVFTVNDPSKGYQTNIDVGGKYSFEKINAWIMYEQLSYNRDFEVLTNSNKERYSQSAKLKYFYTGITYDLTDKFSVQGNFTYASRTGIEEKGNQVDWQEYTPGVGLRYELSSNSDIILGYKHMMYRDDAAQGKNDCNTDVVTTRLLVKF